VNVSSGVAWLILILAGLVEISWALGIRYTGHWTRLWPSILVLLAYIGDLFLLSIPMRQLPVGTVYAVWVGIGSAGVAVGGILLFGESASPARIACLALILTGVVGLKLLE
jgi:quaternary ammonium compound-resistance protein SugE